MSDPFTFEKESGGKYEPMDDPNYPEAWMLCAEDALYECMENRDRKIITKAAFEVIESLIRKLGAWNVGISLIYLGVMIMVKAGSGEELPDNWRPRQ
jgi:hypothetical protein